MDVARDILGDLDLACQGRDPTQGCVRSAVQRLVDLHAVSPAGDLPEMVDGKDFRRAMAERLEPVSHDLFVAVAMVAYDIEIVDRERVYRHLLSRSSLQYLFDDFPGIAAAVVSPADVAQMDEDLLRLLCEHGRLDASRTPANIPSSHWWWREQHRDQTASTVDAS